MPTVYLAKDSGGKVLLKEGAVALDAACCCNDVCPSVTLRCDAISASKSKQGFPPISGFNFGHSGHCYTDVSVACWDDPSEFHEDPTGCLATLSGEVSCSKRYLTLSATLSECICNHIASSGGDFGYVGGGDCGCNGTGSIDFGLSSSLDGVISRVSCSGSVSCYDPAYAHSYSCSDFTDAALQDDIVVDCGDSADVSDEYTTDALISHTVDALPSYPGTFSSLCGATRNLASDESSYSIRRFKYKFTFTTAAAGFTIYWTERFTPTVGSPTDTAKSESQDIGDTESNVFEIDEPDDNGSTTVVNVRWSLDSTDCGDPPVDPESGCDPSIHDCTADYQDCCQP